MSTREDAEHPSGWLIVGLPWPDEAKGGYAECAFVVAPTVIAHDLFTPDARNLLGFAARNLHEAQGKNHALFLSDLTRHLSDEGQSWADAGVRDWEGAVEDIIRQAPGLYLTLSEVAHMVVCDASAEGMIVHFTDASPPQNLRDFREDVRAALAEQLERDWPEYVRNNRPS